VVVALAIGGSDSGAGAGIQADLKTFSAFGVYAATAVTAVTAQNTRHVTCVAPLSSDAVAAQIEAVASDMRLTATKVGMLATSAIVEAVVAAIEALELPMVVVDPVLASSSGERLLDPDGVQALVAELLPKAHVITPNIPEAEALSGCRIQSQSDVRRAAQQLHEITGAAVLVTGGHAAGADVVDLLYAERRFTELRVPRVNLPAGIRTHGTGCTFASALTAGLAMGLPLPEAAGEAQAYVAGAIANAVSVGGGARILDHFWQQRSR
jgi:hydroxymethylpyrimidine/phosphomethylpyrimidine kinase